MRPVAEAAIKPSQDREPLPRLGIILGGGLLGYFYLAEHASALIEGFGYELPDWAIMLACVAVGLVGGIALAKLINWTLALSFRLFNLAFDATTTAYTRTVGENGRDCKTASPMSPGWRHPQSRDSWWKEPATSFGPSQCARLWCWPARRPTPFYWGPWNR